MVDDELFMVVVVASRKPRKTRRPSLEERVRQNTKEIKELKKRVGALESAFSKELASIHEELMKTMFEAFGLVPPTEIGSEYDKLMMKKFGGGDEESEET